MFFQKKTPLSLYLTHGSPLVIKGIARTFSQNDPYLLVTCSYVDCERIYKIQNIDALIIHIGEANHATKNELINLANHHSKPLLHAEFDFFIHQIKSYFKSNYIKLHADGNLFHGGSPNVSGELCALVETLKPHALILFSDTPECVEDARNYLQRRPTQNYYRLPHYRLSGAVAERKTLKEVIASELANPTHIPSHNGCLNFFSNHTRRLLRTPKTYASDESVTTGIHSDTTATNSF